MTWQGREAVMRRYHRPAIIIVLLAIAAVAGAAPTDVLAEGRVRPSALAGGWYPADPETLAAFVDDLLHQAAAARGVPIPDDLRALILPHAGYPYSGATAAAGVALLQGRHFERVLVLAPSHRAGFKGLSIADVDAYETPLGQVPLDQEAITRLRASPLVQAHPWAHEQEHAIEIELPLLQRALAPGWRLLPVLVGALDGDDYDKAADLLRPLADANTLVVVSSDFTHYGERFGYRPFSLDDATAEHIHELDDGALDRIMGKDRDGLLAYHQRTGITICGLRPVAVLLGMLPPDARLERIAYTTSGALTGDFANSVSYAVVAVSSLRPLADTASPGGKPSAATAEGERAAGPAPEAPAPSSDDDLTEADLNLLHRLAVLALQQAVLGRDPQREAVAQALLAELPQRLKRNAGVFVTLKRDGALRGCIGYIEPRKPLYQAVLENGVNAAVNDYRFSPVSAAELDGLEVEVSVLTPPRPIPSPDAFVVGEQGIVLNKAGRRAVFLPEVAVEQGWDRTETLNQLARKAGLAEDAWREGTDLEVFDSIKLSGPYLKRGGGKATGQ